jgi:hypothetical protein
MSPYDLFWFGSVLIVTLGAAVILSTLGITYAASVDRKMSWQAILAETSSLLGLTIGAGLLWCGLLVGSFSYFQKIFWGLVTLGMLYILINKYRGAGGTSVPRDKPGVAPTPVPQKPGVQPTQANPVPLATSTSAANTPDQSPTPACSPPG